MATASRIYRFAQLGEIFMPAIRCLVEAVKPKGDMVILNWNNMNS